MSDDNLIYNDGCSSTSILRN